MDMTTVPYDLQKLLRLATTESHEQSDVLDLAKALHRRSSLFNEAGFREEFENVLTPIAILSADIFATSRSVIKREAATPVLSASSVILSYMITTVSETNIKKFLNPLSALCTGSQSLDSKEKNAAVEALKEAKVFPPGFVLEPGVAQQRPPKPPSLPYASMPSFDSNENQDVINRPQTDLTSSILVQLQSPYEQTTRLDTSSPSHLDDDFHLLSNKSTNHLRSLEAGDKLTDICLRLPELSKYIEQWENAVDGEETTVSINQVNNLSALLEDVEIAWKALTLPILEPLTTDMLQKVTKIVKGCLVASVSVASSPVTSDEIETISIEIVENSLELFNTILTTIRQSTRAGGHVLQNYIMMGAWVLTSGLLVQLASAMETSPTTTKPRLPLADLMSHGLNLNKVQQRFNVLSVALASEALTLTSLLLEDLSSEMASDKNEGTATLDLFTNFKASQRVALILNSVPLIPLLFNVAFVSFSKGLMNTDSANKTNRSGETSNAEGSKEEEVDEDDDDSEPLLGRWFEETLSLFPSEDKKTKKTKSEMGGPGSSTLLAKIEPSGFFVSLASHIFIFLNKHMLTSEATIISNYIKNGLAEPQMIVLADMIHDLEGYEKTYPELTNALSTFTHNILAMGLLTSKLQNSLLSQLGVSPWQDGGFWPLHVQPRTLTILAHVLLLRQTNTDQDLTGSSRPITNTYTTIWERVLSSLTEAVLEDDDESNKFDDLNVEHLQLLLFLFHALALMQKKQLLLFTANCIIKVSKVKKVTQRQIMHTSRLVMILEYIMKNLYEPPKSLMDEVQQNIFKRHANSELKYHGFAEITEKQPKKFYNLFEAAPASEFSSEIPKLDGLALSFILGTSESLKYAQLYQALIENLNVAKGDDLDQVILELAAKELNHLAAILQHYAGGLTFMK